MTNRLLAVASLAEGLFGVFVLAVPAFAYTVFFGGHSVESGIIMTRLAGIALLGLSLSCYPPATSRAFYGMLTYNVLIMIFLIVIGIGGRAGVLLWPAVAFHAIMSFSLIATARLGK